MKIIKALVMSVLTLSLFFCITFPSEAEGKWGLYHREVYQDMYLYFANENNKTIELSMHNKKVCEPVFHPKVYKNLIIQLKSGETIRIKNGLFYSKGKLFTGALETKKARQDEHDYNWYKFKIKKGKIINGTEYVSFKIIPDHD